MGDLIRRGIPLILVLACTSGLEPSNTDLGLHVDAWVTPTEVSLHDTRAAILITVVVTNPSGDAVTFETGGPPFQVTADPAQSKGLAASSRIANGTDPLNAGPGLDSWEGPEVTFIPHGRRTWNYEVTLRAWRDGNWELTPGVYRVRSYYNGREGESHTFTVTP
jgi:hypothetical protein